MSDAGSGTIERREYKYLVPPSQFPAIRSFLKGRCSLDHNAGPNGMYAIRSLYLDTGDLRLARANAAEVHTRFKVRVRTYPGKPAPVFLEIKRRYGDVIRKIRTRVPSTSWPELLEQPISDVPEGAVRFVDMVRALDLRPICLVEYDREAWMSEVDDYARVTFDLAIGCERADGWTLEPPTHARLPIDHPGVTATFEPVGVLEIKFADAPPRWMVTLVERFELMRQAYSKYVNSVDALQEMGDLGARAVGS